MSYVLVICSRSRFKSSTSFFFVCLRLSMLLTPLSLLYPHSSSHHLDYSSFPTNISPMSEKVYHATQPFAPADCYLCFPIGQRTLSEALEEKYPNLTERNGVARSMIHICLSFHRLHGYPLMPYQARLFFRVMQGLDFRLALELGGTFLSELYRFSVSRFSWMRTSDLYLEPVLSTLRNLTLECYPGYDPMVIPFDRSKTDIEGHPLPLTVTSMCLYSIRRPC